MRLSLLDLCHGPERRSDCFGPSTLFDEPSQSSCVHGQCPKSSRAKAPKQVPPPSIFSHPSLHCIGPPCHPHLSFATSLHLGSGTCHPTPTSHLATTLELARKFRKAPSPSSRCNPCRLLTLVPPLLTELTTSTMVTHNQLVKLGLTARLLSPQRTLRLEPSRRLPRPPRNSRAPTTCELASALAVGWYYH